MPQHTEAERRRRAAILAPGVGELADVPPFDPGIGADALTLDPAPGAEGLTLPVGAGPARGLLGIPAVGAPAAPVVPEAQPATAKPAAPQPAGDKQATTQPVISLTIDKAGGDKIAAKVPASGVSSEEVAAILKTVRGAIDDSQAPRRRTLTSRNQAILAARPAAAQGISPADQEGIQTATDSFIRDRAGGAPPARTIAGLDAERRQIITSGPFRPTGSFETRRPTEPLRAATADEKLQQEAAEARAIESSADPEKARIRQAQVLKTRADPNVAIARERVKEQMETLKKMRTERRDSFVSGLTERTEARARRRAGLPPKPAEREPTTAESVAAITAQGRISEAQIKAGGATRVQAAKDLATRTRDLSDQDKRRANARKVPFDRSVAVEKRARSLWKKEDDELNLRKAELAGFGPTDVGREDKENSIKKLQGVVDKLKIKLDDANDDITEAFKVWRTEVDKGAGISTAQPEADTATTDASLSAISSAGVILPARGATLTDDQQTAMFNAILPTVGGDRQRAVDAVKQLASSQGWQTI